MYLCVISLWMLAIILIAIDRESENNRWAAAVAVTGGFEGLSRTLLESINQYKLDKNFVEDFHYVFLNASHSISTSISDYGLPYAFIMFAICYCGFFKAKQKNILAIVLLLPMLVMFCMSLLHQKSNNGYLSFLWAIAYFVFGNIKIQHSGT